MIIGLTGSLGAGKDTIIEYLASHGFQYFNLSNELREMATKRGIELTRTNLQDLGNEIRLQEGNGALILRVMAKTEPLYDYVIAGIRNPGEIQELKKNKNFFLISIDAPAQLRFTRLTKRNRESDPRTWEEFLKIDSRDKGDGEAENGQQVAASIELADFHMYNDGDIGAANQKIKEIVGKITDIIAERIEA